MYPCIQLIKGHISIATSAIFSNSLIYKELYVVQSLQIFHNWDEFGRK